MIGLIEAIVDRAAEILQTVSNELEALSTEIFTPNWSGSQADLWPVLQSVGRNGDIAMRVRESLHSFARIVPYLQSAKIAGTSDDA
ncbi:MAG: hypothetical protein ACJ8AH_13315 [Stellaceae bacterium]|jgi:magnesium transporter